MVDGKVMNSDTRQWTPTNHNLHFSITCMRETVGTRCTVYLAASMTSVLFTFTIFTVMHAKEPCALIISGNE